MLIVKMNKINKYILKILNNKNREILFEAKQPHIFHKSMR